MTQEEPHSLGKGYVQVYTGNCKGKTNDTKKEDLTPLTLYGAI